MNTISPSEDHVAAVNRERRIIVEYDAFDPHQALAADFKDWLKFRFELIDDPAAQIFSPDPQPAKGDFAHASADTSDQRLARLTFSAVPSQLRVGANTVTVRLAERAPFIPGMDLQLEKIEIHVTYR